MASTPPNNGFVPGFPPPPSKPASLSLPSPSTSTPHQPRTRSPPLPPAKDFPPIPSPYIPYFSLSPPMASSSAGLAMVVGITIGGIVVLIVLTLVWFLCKKKRRKDDETALGPKARNSCSGKAQQNASQPSDHVVTSLPPPQQSPRPLVMSSSSSSDSNYSEHSVLPPSSPMLVLGTYQGTFSYNELARATNRFSGANLLGQGGSGYVFKGILRSGKEIAVKQLKAGSVQGEREFRAEIEIISRVHHKHLVTLVGYCIAGLQRLIVYEFVSNNSLEFHLHGKRQPPMEWSLRLKIAVGSAKGLSYLHENCNHKIIHGDVKAANILIDSKFEAKVADFGLAKIVPDTITHVSTRVMGTFGYLAPEYAASGKLTEKSDVYSFGIVLLELITGRRPLDSKNDFQEDNLVDWGLPLLNQASEEGDFEFLADRKMNNKYNIEEMARMVACAAACVRYLARHRPSMDQVARVLDGNLSPSELKQEIQPAGSRHCGRIVTLARTIK